ncbi:MAG: hypothetical protein FWC36_10960 [Spirochaetes bacterium]|nr:hypothetical protein [Spirochaetota bacterium]
MGGVIKKKKKSLLVKIIGNIKEDSLSYKKEGITSDVLTDCIRITEVNTAIITKRRNDLIAAKYDNSDVIVTSGNNN